MKDHNEQQEQENVDDVDGKEVEQPSPLEEKQLKKEKIAARRNLFLVIAAIGAALSGAAWYVYRYLSYPTVDSGLHGPHMPPLLTPDGSIERPTILEPDGTPGVHW